MKNTVEMNSAPIGTPTIVFCSDPSHNESDALFIRESGPSQTYKPLNLQVGRLKTTLKVNVF